MSRGAVLPHILCYDIRDSTRLRQVAKTACDHGVRLQFSLFLCWLTSDEANDLMAELESMVAPVDDVRLYPLPKEPNWAVFGRTAIEGLQWLGNSWPSAPN